MQSTELAKSRQIELILRQIDSLPTLPSVATRLLSLTADDDSQMKEVVELISADQALTAKILALCRTADVGVREEVLTIDHAVMLLGFNSIRNAVLSVQVFQAFNADSDSAYPESPEPPEEHPDPSVGPDDLRNPGSFDRPSFWRHCLAVAVAAELIADGHLGCEDVPGSEAFVCGLLHDIGKLALYHVLPKSYDRVISLTDINQNNIAEFERRVLGIDHHTAGKRLAEQWQLPHRIQDCIWLHGTPFDLLPRLDHRRMVGLVGLADLVVRRNHLGFSGNFVMHEEPSDLAVALGFDPDLIERITKELHEQVQIRAEAMGLEDQPSSELYMASIQNANFALGKLNRSLDRRSRTATKQAHILDSIAAFHAGVTAGRNTQDLLDAVVDSAQSVLGRGFYAMLFPDTSGKSDALAWLICLFSQDGEPLEKRWVDPPLGAPDLAKMDTPHCVSMDLMGVLPSIAEYLTNAPEVRRVRLLPLNCSWGTVSILLHDQNTLPPWIQMQALTSTWGAAIASACQHDGARRLGEQLAVSNRMLAQTQDRLLQTESMVRLGEMAAGAAHEMNNPLTVISGRAQLLAFNLPQGSENQLAAQTLVEQAQRLSDLITALRMFVDPPEPNRRPTDMSSLLHDATKRIAGDHEMGELPRIFVKIQTDIPTVMIDPEQIGQAITELLKNSVQAQPERSIEISAKIYSDPFRLIIKAIDDGVGMDTYTLSHAMDPFFSARKIGRSMGMGLPRAKQWAVGHGGSLELRSKPDEGTTAIMTLPFED